MLAHSLLQLNNFARIVAALHFYLLRKAMRLQPFIFVTLWVLASFQSCFAADEAASSGITPIHSTQLALQFSKKIAKPVTTQLPRTVRPLHYAIFVTPNAAAATFSGAVAIDIEVIRQTNRITFNAADLTIEQATLDSNGTLFGAQQINLDAEAQTATLIFKQLLKVGKYRLNMDYNGVISTQANGLFLVDYVTTNGKQRALYTQFENSDARRFVPCWDEPNFKTTFDLTVTVPSGQMAVSNMPILTQTALDNGINGMNGMTRVTFQTTPKMSSYLLFMALGDFERVTDKLGNTELGVITQRGLLSQAAFPLASTKAILQQYNDYFGVTYPLPKLDNVAAPGSSEFFGAMENWGAIFTFEHDILLNPTISTQRDKEASFSTAAHEIAHQWFGDLVTMQWWDDLWLNEGFASWMESRTTQKLHPEWDTNLLLVDVHQRAMWLDAINNTHPVVQHVATVEQASQAFDDITYKKGESVITMLENYVGENAWRNGVRAYMAKHAYGNTSSADFWAAIQAATDKPIMQIAHDFTLQPGVPLIKLIGQKCSAGKTTVELEQGEFNTDIGDNNARITKPPLRWHVPVNIALINENGVVASANLLTHQTHQKLTLNGCGAVLLNAGQFGYFRPQLDSVELHKLMAHFDKLAPIDQLGLIANTFSLSRIGTTSMADALDLTQLGLASNNPQINSLALKTLMNLRRNYALNSNEQRTFDVYATQQLSTVMARVSWQAQPDESSTTAKLRELLIDALSEMQDPKTVQQVRHYFNHQSSDLPAALNNVITRTVAMTADSLLWEQLHAKALAETSSMIKDNDYLALATAIDPALAQRALDLALTDEPNPTISAAMIEAVANHYPDMAFDFCMNHLEHINKLVDSNSRSRYIPRIATESADPAMKTKLQNYAKNNLAKTAWGDTKTALAAINYQIYIRQKRLPEVNAWLAAH